jgi:nitrogen fixation NifU-like protein
MFDDLRDLYQDVILDRGRNPRHGLRLEVFDATAKGDNPMCGDRVQVWVRRAGDGSVANVGFEARGCHISIAAADLMVDAVQGLAAEDARTLFATFTKLVRTGHADAAPAELQPMAGVHEFPSRVKCATLPWHALMAALDGAQEASSE